MKQTTNTILMVEPVRFGFNPEAAGTNSFQLSPAEFTPEQIQDIALLEFKNAVANLRRLGVEVVEFRDPDTACTTDSVFPNNWFSTHTEGMLVTYPMAIKSRRAERREDIIRHLRDTYHYQHHFMLEELEQQLEPAYLEGTGSLVLDRVQKLAFAALSPRTHLKALKAFCQKTGYTAVPFQAYGPGGELIYHTNVMMCIGRSYALIGMDVIEPAEREMVREKLQQSGKEIIELSKRQVHSCFAGNMLQLENNKGESILAMSKTAYESLSQEQIATLQAHNDHLLPLPVHMIEKCGGGSVRCMIAEIFPAAAH